MTDRTQHIETNAVRYVKELYPRLKPSDEVIERYREALDNLPPIVIARDGILVDGYHRWQAHAREGAEQIEAEHLGNLADAEILREAYRRNATHGHQLSSTDKKRAADHLYRSGTTDIGDIAGMLGITEATAKKYVAGARKDEKAEQQSKAWDMWLDCWTQQKIADEIGVEQRTVSNWLEKTELDSGFSNAPASRQHFDVWQFATADKDSGQQSYFGAVPPQVLENLLWFYTEPGDIVTDLFAGSGTTVDVAKRMGRRVWAADIRGDHYNPHLPIRTHDATQGWPDDAPRKAKLTFLDPPYWKQAAGRYSSEPSELGEMNLAEFYDAWHAVATAAMEHSERVAYIISPTQNADGSVVDHATDMLAPFHDNDWKVERRIIVTYSTQQATGQQVTWARDNKRMLKLYRDLIILSAR